MHLLVPTFDAPTPSKEGSTIIQHYPAKLLESRNFSNFAGFQILVPHRESTLHTPRILRFSFPTPRRNRGLLLAPLRL
ncbi:hypothetical protein TNCV_4877791 [Trichonephila clavipes]|nr:hypothetical protein TNCV_4877791 [Trichonephila clavipes]